MEIIYLPKAIRDLKRLPQNVQKRIAEKMRFYKSSKNPLEYAKKLTFYEMGEFRFRVGDYRVIFDLKGNKIYVLKIRKRDDVYN